MSHYAQQLKIQHTIALLRDCAAQDSLFSSKKNDQLLQHLVTDLLSFAGETGSSDIHIEPQEHDIRIRLRHDGVLAEYFHLPSSLLPQLCCKLKILANMDISQARLPQDSKFMFSSDQVQKFHVRMSTCPTVRGEKIALRILQDSTQALKLQDLGWMPQQFQNFVHGIAEPNGLILITGPTGSGKTSTLYAALTHLNTPEKNIITLEDPVEILLPGINQISINPKAELHFATVLRAILRQDPDVIMLGEIRDEETAQIAIKAANTGHLVLSTLHTNNCLATMNRLRQMQIDQDDLLHCLRLIVSQRLLRKKCVHCQAQVAVNCTCYHGYRGRHGIFEFLEMNPQVHELWRTKKLLTEEDLHSISSFSSLKEQARRCIAEGITTPAEMMRVMNLC